MEVSTFYEGPRKSPSHTLSVRQKNNDRPKQRKRTAYCQVINYLLATYAPDDMIAEAEALISIFKQPVYMYAVGYSEVLCKRALRCGLVHEKGGLKGVCIGRLHESVRLLIRSYRCALKDATLQRLAWHATSFMKLQVGINSTSTGSRNKRYKQHKPKASTRRGQNNPNMGIQERRDSNSFSCSWKTSFHSKQRRANHESYKLTKQL